MDMSAFFCVGRALQWADSPSRESYENV